MLDSNLLFLIVAVVTVLVAYNMFGIIPAMIASGVFVAYFMYLREPQYSDPRIRSRPIGRLSPRYFTPEDQ